MKDTDKIFCSILFDILQERGVKDVVCSPGSRNTPLLLAVASRQNLKKHFAYDERSAAFMALGIALASNRPVALVCTSGTALLNYSPAIAEAYYHAIPLIVISADRPSQWIDQDDSQTIRQTEVLSNFVKKSYQFPLDTEINPELKWYVNRIVNDAMMTATSRRSGPIHINVPLGEPLGNKIDVVSKLPRLIDIIEADSIGNKEIVRELAKKISRSKVLFVAGFMQPNANLQKVISDIARLPNIVIMAETISNLHLDPLDYSIDSVLTALSKKELETLKPDIVITIGGSLVSRKLKEYLRNFSTDIEHWSIGYSHTTTDCFQSLSKRIECDTVRFLRNLKGFLFKLRPEDSVLSYKKDWIAKREKALRAKQLFIANSSWSELKIFDYLLKQLPSSVNLLLSNGTPIRYAQLISYKLPHASWCNRGVSGIDGTVACAIGLSKIYKGTTLLISGDLSMAYDIGSLGLPEIPDRLKIIVIDNQGGGIFRFVPSTRSLEEREEYFCMDPKLPLKELASGYEWDYFEINDENSLAKNLKSFMDNPRKSIMKITCNGIQSADILSAYMKIK